jgi:predicted  nucleic acid-binding Zn-ribbon protein
VVQVEKQDAQALVARYQSLKTELDRLQQEVRQHEADAKAAERQLADLLGQVRAEHPDREIASLKDLEALHADLEAELERLLTEGEQILADYEQAKEGLHGDDGQPAD